MQSSSSHSNTRGDKRSSSKERHSAKRPSDPPTAAKASHLEEVSVKKKKKHKERDKEKPEGEKHISKEHRHSSHPPRDSGGHDGKHGSHGGRSQDKKATSKDREKEKESENEKKLKEKNRSEKEKSKHKESSVKKPHKSSKSSKRPREEEESDRSLEASSHRSPTTTASAKWTSGLGEPLGKKNAPMTKLKPFFAELSTGEQSDSDPFEEPPPALNNPQVISYRSAPPDLGFGSPPHTTPPRLPTGANTEVLDMEISDSTADENVDVTAVEDEEVRGDQHLSGAGVVPSSRGASLYQSQQQGPLSRGSHGSKMSPRAALTAEPEDSLPHAARVGSSVASTKPWPQDQGLERHHTTVDKRPRNMAPLPEKKPLSSKSPRLTDSVDLRKLNSGNSARDRRPSPNRVPDSKKPSSGPSKPEGSQSQASFPSAARSTVPTSFCNGNQSADMEKENLRSSVISNGHVAGRQEFGDGHTTADYEEQCAMNGEDFSILLELQRRLMNTNDSDLLQRVVKVIQETGKFNISAATFDFDLCMLDSETVRRLQDCLDMG